MAMAWWNLAGWPTADEWAALWGLGTMLAAMGTLVAAVIAGIYAARAARATREQADAAGEDVALAKDALELARTQAAEARSESERATRWSEERRVDAFAPSVFMLARPGIGDPTKGFQMERMEWPDKWRWMSDPEPFDGTERSVVFRQSVAINLSNVSEVPARVAFFRLDGGELVDERGLPIPGGGGPVWVLPRKSVDVVWRRQVTLDDILDPDDLKREGAMLFRVEAFVTDVGGNVSDLYRFSGALVYLSIQDGVVTVGGALSDQWTERAGVPVERAYLRL